MLEANNVDAAAKLFAATTLKGKVGRSRNWCSTSNTSRSCMTSTNCPASRSRIYASLS